MRPPNWQEIRPATEAAKAAPESPRAAPHEPDAPLAGELPEADALVRNLRAMRDIPPDRMHRPFDAPARARRAKTATREAVVTATTRPKAAGENVVEMRACKQCAVPRPLSKFAKSGRGRKKICLVCEERSKAEGDGDRPERQRSALRASISPAAATPLQGDQVMFLAFHDGVRIGRAQGSPSGVIRFIDCVDITWAQHEELCALRRPTT